MNNRNERKPTETFETYWIFELNENYKFLKDRSERESGKWLIFEHKKHIDNTWELIKEATKNGLLGPSSKVSTSKPNLNSKDKNYYVICVFTEDYNNEEDLKRVEENLRKLGIENRLSYKLDKDVGKYERNGIKGLIKKESYSEKYNQIASNIDKLQVTSNIILISENEEEKIYVLKRNNLIIEEYENKIIELRRLGFKFDYETEIKDEEIQFTK